MDTNDSSAVYEKNIISLRKTEYTCSRFAVLFVLRSQMLLHVLFFFVAVCAVFFFSFFFFLLLRIPFFFFYLNFNWRWGFFSQKASSSPS